MLQDSAMRAHILQHVSFEGLGSIEPWLYNQGADLSWTRFFENSHLPPLDEVDFIIALGGPMSVNDEEQFPWLVDEKRFLAGAIQGGKTVLGICLGAQLMASAMGSSVFPSKEKEIGWFSVHAEQYRPDLFPFPAVTDAFHWHGETFDLPPAAARLAHSAACRNQAFQLGKRAMGLQFHLETTPESADAIITHCAHELVDGPFIQSEAELRRIPADRYRSLNTLMVGILEYLTREAA